MNGFNLADKRVGIAGQPGMVGCADKLRGLRAFLYGDHAERPLAATA